MYDEAFRVFWEQKGSFERTKEEIKEEQFRFSQFPNLKRPMTNAEKLNSFLKEN